AISTAAGWLLRIVGNRVEFLFRERATIAIEAHVVHLQGSVASIEHHERPEYLDRLQILKDHVFLLNHLYPALMSSVGAVARVAITVGLLMSVHPALIALVIFAVPTVVASSWRAGVERKAEEAAAPRRRLAKHFFDLATMAGPGKEVRVWRLGPRLISWRRTAWDQWFAQTAAVRARSAAWHALAWSLFGAAYVGAIVFVSSIVQASAGGVVVVVAAGANLSRFLGMTASQSDFLRWCLEAAQRLAWLEDYAASRAVREVVPAPARIKRAIYLQDVSFRYPGTEAWVLQDVDLELPAGSVVAIVGENGAGKTTLVKLLSRFYEPTSGRILIDDVELAQISADEWRSKLAGAYQDFMRFEFSARRTIGIGDLPRMELESAVRTAVDRAGAVDVIDRLPSGLETQLGPTWAEGVEISFGQWQKLALARGFMRDAPLLLALDEPTAALDAETEHALFERFAEASRASRETGRVTILVSHRFSTVRMADLIVVIDGGRVVEVGSHDDLLARNGLYADLYGIQARAYR
ncbi:MAG TPA: ABC transporter ATP-binding protein, partial [Actinomycetota bacterium]|nr:ABC transporter ATP-binding protein [Actinomycetota bacterium]